MRINIPGTEDNHQSHKPNPAPSEKPKSLAESKATKRRFSSLEFVHVDQITCFPYAVVVDATWLFYSNTHRLTSSNLITNLGKGLSLGFWTTSGDSLFGTAAIFDGQLVVDVCNHDLTSLSPEQAVRVKAELPKSLDKFELNEDRKTLQAIGPWLLSAPTGHPLDAMHTQRVRFERWSEVDALAGNIWINDHDFCLDNLQLSGQSPNAPNRKDELIKELKTDIAAELKVFKKRAHSQ